jgi:hypothetical protein
MTLRVGTWNAHEGTVAYVHRAIKLIALLQMTIAFEVNAPVLSKNEF